MDNKKTLFRLWLVIIPIMIFLGVLFLSIMYLDNQVFCDLGCEQKNKAIIAFILFPLMGIFIGSITYYLMSGKYNKKMEKMSKDLLYKFLESDEKKIIKSLFDNNGQILQSNLPKLTGLSRVKISRTIKDLENKDIIEKEKKGMTNLISLKKEFNVFL